MDLNKTVRQSPVIASSPQGRFEEEAALLDGRTLNAAEAWGKHLFMDFDGAPLLHIHLGLIGKFRKKPVDACLLYTSPSPRDRQKSRMPSSA